MEKYRFTDCVDIVGNVCKPFEGSKKYVSTGAVENDHIVESDIVIVEFKSKPSRANLTAESGDILFAKMMGTKKTLLLDDITAQNVYSTGFCAVRAKEDILSPCCLYHLLSSTAFLEQKDKNCSGATQKAITNAGLDNIIISLPKVDEQDAITHQLNKIVAIIHMRQKEIQKLDDLIKARFVDMCGDPVTNEKNWPLVSLSDVAEIRIGPFGTLLHKEDYITGGHALVNPSHIVDGIIRTDEKLTISDEKYDELSAYHLLVGDIVLGRRGEMGRCAVVYQEGLLCGTGSMIVRPTEKMKPYFLQNIISSTAYKKIIEDKAVGVTMMNINVPIVSSLTIPLLPIDMQEHFITFMQQTEKSKAAVQKSLDKLQTLFDKLMQEYFG